MSSRTKQLRIVENVASVGLNLGSSRRVLPTSLELLILSFLPQNDLPSVFWVSKALLALVKRFLAQTKTLNGADEALAELAVKYCHQLQEIEGFRSEVKATVLLRILANNRASLRRFPISQSTPYALRTSTVVNALTRCPQLEAFEFIMHISDTWVAADCWASLTPSVLPHLRALSVSRHTIKFEHAVALLNRGLFVLLCLCDRSHVSRLQTHHSAPVRAAARHSPRTQSAKPS